MVVDDGAFTDGGTDEIVALIQKSTG